MIKLIQNELTKLFKKKFLWIMLIITIAFSIFTNFMNYKYSNNGPSAADIANYKSYHQSDLEYYQSANIPQAEKANMIINAKTEIKLYELVEEYGVDSWQAYIITNVGDNLRNALYNINSFKEISNSATDYEVDPTHNLEYYQKSYEDIITRFNNDDWKSFVQAEIDSYSNIEDNINKAKVQTLKWRLEYDIPYGYDYQNEAIETFYFSYPTKLAYESLSDKEIEKLTFTEEKNYKRQISQAEKAEYDIINQTNYNNNTAPSNILITSISSFNMLILILVIVIGAGMIADEFNKGTIKLLLVRPYSRIKIIAAKFIATLLMLLMGILAMYIIQFLIIGIIYGFNNYSASSIIFDYNSMSVVKYSAFKLIILNIIGLLPMFILMLTLAFALGTLFNNAGIAIGVSLLGIFGSELINVLAIELNVKWLKYFVTLNWDSTIYLHGNFPLMEGLTPLFSNLICLIYFIIMIVVTFTVFKKRNIKNI